MITSRIQLCGELGSTRFGSGKRIMVKTVTPYWQLSTYQECTALKTDISIEKYIFMQRQ